MNINDTLGRLVADVGAGAAIAVAEEWQRTLEDLAEATGPGTPERMATMFLLRGLNGSIEQHFPPLTLH